MDHIGIDVHKKESQICILAEGGELIEQRIRTEPERFAAVLGALGPGRGSCSRARLQSAGAGFSDRAMAVSATRGRQRSPASPGLTRSCHS